MVRRLLLSVLCVLAMAALSSAVSDLIPRPDNTIKDWNVLINQEVARLSINSNRATRTFATIHTAQWRALVAVLESKRILLKNVRDTSKDVKISLAFNAIKTAVAAAALEVVTLNQNATAWPNVRLFPPPANNPNNLAVNLTFFQTLYSAQIASLPAPGADADAIVIAKKIARDVIAERNGDGAWPVPIGLGTEFAGYPNIDYLWRKTPSRLSNSNFSGAVDPIWGQVKPFALTSGDQFRAREPEDRQSVLYQRDYDELRNNYGWPTPITNANLFTAEFWRGNTEYYSFQQAWAVNAGERLDIIRSTLLFAVLSAALADSRIASYETKYHYLTWRPITAIRAGNGVGFQPPYVANASWEAAIGTPQHPEYTSGHVTSGAAGNPVLRAFAGRDSYNFTLNALGNDAQRGPRNYTSFSQALNEQSESRIVGGVHWRETNEVSFIQGRQVGEWALKYYGLGNYIWTSAKRRLEGEEEVVAEEEVGGEATTGAATNVSE